jgi:hypothetical protein
MPIVLLAFGSFRYGVWQFLLFALILCVLFLALTLLTSTCPRGTGYCLACAYCR